MAVAKKAGSRNLPRAQASNVQIFVGVLMETFSLHPMQDSSSKRAIKTIMLDDADHPVEQVYLCRDGSCSYPAGQDGFKTGDLSHRGRVVGTGVIPIPPEELAELVGSKLPKGVLELDLCPSEQVDGQTWAYGTAYWAEPARSSPFYLALCEKIAEGEVAAIGTINLAGNDKFVRLMPHNGGIVVQEMLRPGDTYQFEAISGEVSDKNRVALDVLFEAATEDFDPEAYESDRVAALRALIASKESGQPIEVSAAPKAVQAPVDDIEAQLAASLALLAAKKAAKAAKAV